MATSDAPINVLFLCTGNSARSILAEALLNSMGRGRFRAYSAGSHPAGRVNALALALLRDAGLPTEGLRSKGWDEFAVPGAPVMDMVITVCDNAAGEACPAWPGKPSRAHWGLADPAAVEGPPEKRRAAFQETARLLRLRIETLAALPRDKLLKSVP
jgi:arsenate reductase (thioredoxin)